MLPESEYEEEMFQVTPKVSQILKNSRLYVNYIVKKES